MSISPCVVWRMTLPDVGGSREYTSDIIIRSSGSSILSLSLLLGLLGLLILLFPRGKRAKQSVAFASLFPLSNWKTIRRKFKTYERKPKGTPALRIPREEEEEEKALSSLFDSFSTTRGRSLVVVVVVVVAETRLSRHGEAASNNTNTFTRR